MRANELPDEADEIADLGVVELRDVDCTFSKAISSLKARRSTCVLGDCMMARFRCDGRLNRERR